MRRFLFDLGLALGEWDVDTMSRNMSLPLFHEWRAYFRQQPLPWKRDDMHAALMAMVFRNTMVSLRVKYPKLMTMKDYMLEFKAVDSRLRGNDKVQTPGEIYQDLKTALLLGPGISG